MEHSYMTPSPMVKHEDFQSDDGMMPSLFSGEAASPSDTMDNWATPDRDMLSPLPESTPEAGEKKPKKRKSWGQVLPEPKTQLPPRKRAKTEDEKEQRRVERVLRNRRAAQSSRERKRQETELLATQNKKLQQDLDMLAKQNAVLITELKKLKPDFADAMASTFSPTLGRDLFLAPASRSQEDTEEAQKERKISHGTNELIQDIVRKQTPSTVNPASLSPAMSPAAEELDFVSGGAPETATAALDMFDAERAADSTTRSMQYSAVSTAGGVDAFGAHVAVPDRGFSTFDSFPFNMDTADFPSPESSILDFDHTSSNEFAHAGGAEFLDLLDFSNLHEGDGALDEQQFQQEDVASQNPQEVSYQQPTAGASTPGRDARGNAVEAF